MVNWIMQAQQCTFFSFRLQHLIVRSHPIHNGRGKTVWLPAKLVNLTGHVSCKASPCRMPCPYKIDSAKGVVLFREIVALSRPPTWSQQTDPGWILQMNRQGKRLIHLLTRLKRYLKNATKERSSMKLYETSIIQKNSDLYNLSYKENTVSYRNWIYN